MRFLLAVVLVMVGVVVFADDPPNLAQWESDMLTYGDQRCDVLASGISAEGKLGETFYDSMFTFHKMAEYTGNADWRTCADLAESAYRDYYVIPNNGYIQGYWVFTDGLRKDWEFEADALSKQYAIQLSVFSPFCFGDYTPPLEALESADYQREVSYCVRAFINAESFGEAERARRDAYVTLLLDYLDQVYITKDYSCGVSWKPCDPLIADGKYYVQPFMAGLVMRALIEDWKQTGDVRTPPAIKTTLDWLWDNAWISASQAFWYQNWAETSAGPWTAPAEYVTAAPDLNLLIATAYEWYYQYSGTATYRTRGEAVFSGGVLNGSPGYDGKHFNQQYTWSFEYVSLYQGDDPVITTTSLPNGTVGVPYSQLISVSGGTLPYTACDETVGALPSGSPAFTTTPEAGGCRIAGTPTGAEVASFTERVTATGGATGSRALTLTIEAASAPTITTTSVPNGIEDTPYSATIVCSGGVPPYTFTVQSGSLCTGTTLDEDTGEISGTTTTVESCSYTIRCTDSAPLFDDQAFTNQVVSAVSPLVATARPGATYVVLKFGVAGLDAAYSCEAQVFGAGNQFAGVGISESGPAKRDVVISGLTASTEYRADMTCSKPPLAPVPLQSITFTTLATSSAGDRTVPISFGDSSLSAAARVTVEYDDNAALSSPATEQNTSCGSGCTVNLTIPAGLWYFRHKWQDGSDNVLATGSVQALLVE